VLHNPDGHNLRANCMSERIRSYKLSKQSCRPRIGLDVTVSFCQIYIEMGVSFPLTYHFQVFLSKCIGKLIKPSSLFRKKYGSGFDLGFNISAKGPTVFRKTKDVDYTVFLPFDVIQARNAPLSAALECLIEGVISVLKSLDIATDELRTQKCRIIQEVPSNPIMIENVASQRGAPK
jgi:hypothetical protein